MRDHQRSPEELEQIYEEHKTKFGPERDSTIKTVEHFIDEVSKTSQLDVDYLWTYTDHRLDAGDRDNHWRHKIWDGEQYYTACLCRMPEMKC